MEGNAIPFHLNQNQYEKALFIMTGQAKGADAVTFTKEKDDSGAIVNIMA